MSSSSPEKSTFSYFVTEQVKVEASISAIALTLKELDICGSDLEMLDQELGAKNKQNVYYSNFPKATVCHTCGTRTTVPSQPTGDKPVYCRDCFISHRQQY
jgi:CxxC-x17-CxxC domain-containing protein